jgi:hypothetical protein
MDEPIVPRCVVCRTELPPDPYLCPKCETPHHHDCWEYAGGCAVYGCFAGRPQRPPPPSSQPFPLDERAIGAIFGALLGFGVVGSAFGAVGRVEEGRHVGLVMAEVAAITGALAGWTVRSPSSWGWIMFWGLFGPGLGSWLMVLADATGTHSPDFFTLPMLLLPFALLGMIMAPAAIPCAWLVGRFNDPAGKTPARRRRDLLCAGALAVLAAIIIVRSLN